MFYVKSYKNVWLCLSLTLQESEYSLLPFEYINKMKSDDLLL